MSVPEQGQLVRARNRFFFVKDVLPYQPKPTDTVIHRVSLECLDDDKLGMTVDLIWEREVNTGIYEAIELPKPTGPDGWDHPDLFQAFIHAIRWSSNSLIEGPEIQSPFHGAIEIDEYQLEPVVRALAMPRANLLIADDVGLGKTIEAALVAQELVARQRVRRMMIVCPASLQLQWQEEMANRFSLDFMIIDSSEINRLRREYGIHVNPWASFPRLITSMDFLKREVPLRLFHDSLQEGNGYALRDWDLLVIDEAHNVAPSGRRAYIKDSDRTRMVRSVIPHFENRLFLTATPHNGYTESFSALLEMLDPLRFSRGPVVDPVQVETVMVRRLKDDITDPLGNRKFPKRVVGSIPVKMGEERELYELLQLYTESRLGRVSYDEHIPVRFALTMLKKRLLSSPLAFSNSIDVHCKVAGKTAEKDESLVGMLTEKAAEDSSDDEEKAQKEAEALEEASSFFASLTPDEQDWLSSMRAKASSMANRADAKFETLLSWIEANLRPGGKWKDERLIVFTEYLDTLNYLEEKLSGKQYENRIIMLVGGMKSADREAVKAAFQAPPSENPVRILLATDAASEGLNLQNHCRNLIHYEIPWNPIRMEQRNGRIDRHGQKAPEVFVFHFFYEGSEDSKFLQVVIDKVVTMREDLGSVGEVIAAQVEEAMLGQRQDLEIPEDRRAKLRKELKAEIQTEARVKEIAQKLSKTRRDLELYPENIQRILDHALRLHGSDGLQPVGTKELAGKAWDLKNLPPQWRECKSALLDEKGRRLALVFDHETAKDRKDVTLVHLNHPLMKRALGTFRAHLWTVDSSTRGLNRVSYRVVGKEKLNTPVVVAFGRLVAISELSQRIHESVVVAGGAIDQKSISFLDEKELAELLSLDYEYPEIPKERADKLRDLFVYHEGILLKSLEKKEKTETTRLSKVLKERAAKETKDISSLIQQRIKELDKRIEEAEAAPPDQMKLFAADEQEQYEEDLKWLRWKRGQLEKDLAAEPSRIQTRYTLRSLKVFPLALLYLLPDSLVK